MKPLRIGAVARQANVGIETVRFYERQGLLPQPQRQESGYRQYDDEDVAILRFIRRAKGLGFTLKEIKVLLDFRLNQSEPRTEIRQQAKAKLADIDAKIADLERMRRVLKALVAQCHGDGPMSGCPILGALQGERDGDLIDQGKQS